MLKRMDITVVSACAAHLLTWCAGLWFAFGPVYQGVSVTATVPGGVASNATQHTATLVEQNGLWVIWLLMLPVLITGLVLLGHPLDRYWPARAQSPPVDVRVDIPGVLRRGDLLDRLVLPPVGARLDVRRHHRLSGTAWQDGNCRLLGIVGFSVEPAVIEGMIGIANEFRLIRTTP